MKSGEINYIGACSCTYMPNPLRVERDAATRRAATQIDEYALFIKVAKFLKRVEVHYSRTDDIYSAKDKKTGHEFVSHFGEGVRVSYARPIRGRPRMEYIREKGTKFHNATEFAFEIYKCVQEIDAFSQG